MIKTPVLAASAALAVAMATVPATAEIRVTFQESAPKDIFQIVNTSGCGMGPVSVEIDLSASSAGLIFDPTASGAGVSVYQPFELVSGDVDGVAEVSDGDTRLSLDLPGLAPGGRVVFTIDIDDTLIDGPMGQTMVAGSEIAGARVNATVPGGQTISGTFGVDAAAAVPLQACIS
ncbi:MAG: hypothetical protein AAGK00_20415 [Pseudomonadota bacterium]